MCMYVRVRHIVTSSVASMAPPHLSTLSHKRHVLHSHKSEGLNFILNYLFLIAEEIIKIYVVLAVFELNSHPVIFGINNTKCN
jgi:hypothetical protein